jgi:hypothetical protein
VRTSPRPDPKSRLTISRRLLNPGTPAVFNGSVFPSCPLGKPVDVHIARQNPTPTKQEKPATKPRSLVNLFGGQRSVSSGSIGTQSHTGSIEPPALAPNALTRHRTGDDLHAIMPISAWTIEASLHLKPIAKAITASVATSLQTALDIGDSQLNNMVLEFVKRFHPSAKTPVQPTPPAADPNSNLHEVDLANADIVAITAALQEFYHDARQRLEAANRERIALADALSDEREKEVKDGRPEFIDVDKSLEQLEAFLCETLYDK